MPAAFEVAEGKWNYPCHETLSSAEKIASSARKTGKCGKAAAWEREAHYKKWLQAACQLQMVFVYGLGSYFMLLLDKWEGYVWEGFDV